MDGVKKLFGEPRINVSQTRGTQDAINYCKKQETRVHPDASPIEHGRIEDVVLRPRGYDRCDHDGGGGPPPSGPGQGSRTDIVLATQLLDTGATMREVAKEYPHIYVPFAKGLQSYAYLQRTPDSTAWAVKNVQWFYGPTGSGKSRRAYVEANAIANDRGVFTKQSGEWFDGYDGEPVVIFDDFRGNWFDYALLLNLLDGRELQVKVKCAFVTWRPTHVFITSPVPPEKTYEIKIDKDGDIDQLMRRVTNLEYIGDRADERNAIDLANREALRVRHGTVAISQYAPLFFPEDTPTLPIEEESASELSFVC